MKVQLAIFILSASIVLGCASVKSVAILHSRYDMAQYNMPLGGKGIIVGRVFDAKTGDPIIGANLIIEATSLGAATSTDGSYGIIKIPPGTYTISVRRIEYERYEFIGLSLDADELVVLDFWLVTSPPEVKEVIVTERQPNRSLNLTRTRAEVSVRSEYSKGSILNGNWVLGY